MCSFRRLVLGVIFAGIGDAADVQGTAPEVPSWLETVRLISRSPVRSQMARPELANSSGHSHDRVPSPPLSWLNLSEPSLARERNVTDVLEVEMLRRIQKQLRVESSKSLTSKLTEKVKLNEIKRTIDWKKLYS